MSAEKYARNKNNCTHNNFNINIYIMQKNDYPLMG